LGTRSQEVAFTLTQVQVRIRKVVSGEEDAVDDGEEEEEISVI